jgi:ADP-ribose pyrophosphatase YjhB (NUDIX family)
VVCARDGAVLLTRNSALAPHPDQWGLPGGGVNHGEHPRDAAVRETHEETGLDVEIGELLDVVSVHFTGVAPSGRLEDYHAIGLVYRATTSDEREPGVVEVDGTTAHAAWVPLDDIASGAVDLGTITAQVLGWAGHLPTPRA